MAPIGGMDIKAFEKLTTGLTPGRPLPVLFIGHGSPMNAIEANYFTEEWKKISLEIPTPKAILCISAHWLTKGTFVTMAEKPKTIYDFYGFPPELYAAKYDAPGAPDYARLAIEASKETIIQPDHEWGLDHGTWSVLKQMFPKADIPTFQLSIDYHRPPSYHYELVRQLKTLRSKGVLVIGSGNIVHNLRLMNMDAETKAFDWASTFDQEMKKFIDARNDEKVMDYHLLGEAAKLSVPTPDHFYPLLYVLGMADKQEELRYYAEKMSMGSISMRSLKLGS